MFTGPKPVKEFERYVVVFGLSFFFGYNTNKYNNPSCCQRFKLFLFLFQKVRFKISKPFLILLFCEFFFQQKSFNFFDAFFFRIVAKNADLSLKKLVLSLKLTNFLLSLFYRKKKTWNNIIFFLDSWNFHLDSWKNNLSKKLLAIHFFKWSFILKMCFNNAC